METDFSKNINCIDGQTREFHFARINSMAIYYHISTLDTNNKLVTATMIMDENGRWQLREPELPDWFKQAEHELCDAVQLSTDK